MTATPVERAIAALRAGRPVAVGKASILSVETATEAILDLLDPRGAAPVLLSGERAAALGVQRVQLPGGELGTPRHAHPRRGASAADPGPHGLGREGRSQLRVGRESVEPSRQGRVWTPDRPEIATGGVARAAELLEVEVRRADMDRLAIS